MILVERISSKNCTGHDWLLTAARVLVSQYAIKLFVVQGGEPVQALASAFNPIEQLVCQCLLLVQTGMPAYVLIPQSCCRSAQQGKNSSARSQRGIAYGFR